MTDVLHLIVSAWLLWCALQVVLLLAAPLLTRGACTNGLWVVIHGHVREQLTDAELAAVIAHEHGHRHHLHAFENLAAACCFIGRTPKRAFQQELEADDWAAERGHGPALASALTRLSQHPSDLARVRRLQRKIEA